MNKRWNDYTLEEKRAYMARVTLMDDRFMTAVLGNSKNGTQAVIRVLMGMDDIRVESVTPQSTLANLSGHSVRLDILAVDALGTRFDIEVQRDARGASLLRARYYSSMLDASQTIQNQDYDTLHDTRVIFLTQEDVLGLNQQCYRIVRMISGDQPVPFADGEQIIYVNMSMQSDTPIGHLAHDFQCSDPEKMYHSELALCVKRFKWIYEEDKMDTIEKEGTLSRQEIHDFWENHWCAEFRDAYHEGMEKGMEKGREEGREEGMVKILTQFMAQTHQSAEAITAQLDISPEERGRLLGLLKASSSLTTNA